MNILVVEDEASIKDRITRLTRNILGDRLQNLTTANNIDEAESLLRQRPFDVLMLDLNLNGKDGFEILKNLSSRSFHTIVVSAHTSRAIEAYEHGVIDFVPKPFDEDRLSQSFQRILGKSATRSHFAKFLAVRCQGKIELVSLDDIEFIQADGPCSLIALKDGGQKHHDKMLKDLALLLPPSFERVHKSYIANINAISSLITGPDHKNFLQFSGARQIPLSRRKTKELKDLLNP